MKNAKRTKKLFIAEIVILLLAILLFAQTTYSYFSSASKSSATVTVGNVSILFSEAAVTRDSTGNLVEDKTQSRVFGSPTGTLHDYGIIYPGQQIYKDPTVQNTGTNEAFIAAKVTLTDGHGDIHRVIGYPNYDEIDVSMLFGGGLLDETAHFGTWNGIEDVTYTDHFAIVQVPHRSEGRYDIYFFILQPLEQGEMITLFDRMFFAPEFTDEEMREFRELRIDTHAFAVQTTGFASCYEAMLNALPDHFSDLPHSAP